MARERAWASVTSREKSVRFRRRVRSGGYGGRVVVVVGSRGGGGIVDDGFCDERA